MERTYGGVALLHLIGDMGEGILILVLHFLEYNIQHSLSSTVPSSHRRRGSAGEVMLLRG